jgi:hypothetical protein
MRPYRAERQRLRPERIRHLVQTNCCSVMRMEKRPFARPCNCNTGYKFFAPGIGMVAMILEEDVTAFWLFNIDSTTGKVLVSK